MPTNTAKKPALTKRIPVGTTVNLETGRAPFTRSIKGVVTRTPGPSAPRASYTVLVDGPRGGTTIYNPYASRLEAQNPTKLKVVK